MELQEALRVTRAALEGDDAEVDFEMAHACTVASEYLKEHPADDSEPVTKDWLTGEGFERIDLKDESPFEVYQHSSGLELWNYIEQHWICDAFDQAGIDREIKTRGDVRQLYAAVGFSHGS